MQYLRQSTASQSVLIGPFVDDTDGTTAETGLTIANTDIRLSAAGGNIAAKNSGGGTHDELGFYTITLNATDTATVGRLQLACKMSGALVVYHEFQVLEEAVYDQLFAASAPGAATVSALSTAQSDLDKITGSDGATLATAQGNYAPAKAGDNMGTVSAVTGGINTGAGTITTLDALDTAQDAQHAATQGATFNGTTDSLEAIRNRGDAEWVTGAGGSAPSAADIRAEIDSNSTQLAAIVADTNELQTNQGNFATATGFSTHSAADVWAAGSRTLSANTNLNDPTAAAIADAILDEAMSGHSTVGSLGKAISDVLADTNELQGDWTNGGRLDLIIDAIKAVTDLLDAAQSEPTGVPAANETPLEKLGYLFMMARNKKTVTATKKTYFDDGGTAEFEADLSDDGTTYIESEINAV